MRACIGSHTSLIDGSRLLPTKRLFRSAANFDFHDHRPKMPDLKSVYTPECWHRVCSRNGKEECLNMLHDFIGRQCGNYFLGKEQTRQINWACEPWVGIKRQQPRKRSKQAQWHKKNTTEIDIRYLICVYLRWLPVRSKYLQKFLFFNRGCVESLQSGSLDVTSACLPKRNNCY